MTSPVLSRSIILTAAGLALSSSVHAQSDIDPTNKYSWEENCGWMNWRDANNALQGVRDRGTYLSGYIWCENVGWINVGNGSPPNGISYINATGADFGVNVNGATGNLSGMAWGENVGWVNFGGGALASPAQPARFDSIANRFRGYAWAEKHRLDQPRRCQLRQVRGSALLRQLRSVHQRADPQRQRFQLLPQQVRGGGCVRQLRSVHDRPDPERQRLLVLPEQVRGRLPVTPC
jgi:hypothetical protein